MNLRGMARGRDGNDVDTVFMYEVLKKKINLKKKKEKIVENAFDF